MLLESILIDETIFEGYKTTNPENTLDNLSKINIFIGVNNSGKSRFLRTLFQSEKYLFSRPQSLYYEINNEIENLKKIFTAKVLNMRYSNPTFPVVEQALAPKYINRLSDLNANKQYITHLLNNTELYFESISGNASIYLDRVENFPTLFSKLKELNAQLTPNSDFKKIYIPTLRGLRPPEGGQDSNSYLKRTKEDYFNKIENLGRIYTGLELFMELKTIVGSIKSERDKKKKFEEFLSLTFFNNHEVEITPLNNSDIVLVRIGEKEHKIHDLGDGIQAIIILTYPLFFNQGDKLQIFIEEPELFLHPGYQRLLIETLMREEFKDFQFYITTHSNHFLDITLDIDNISVYTFNEKYDENQNSIGFQIENVKNDDLDVLGLIGVKNSSVFLSNCTIWVEGITDRIYLRKYLQLYQDTQKFKFKEDYHFSFVEYGGGNITHWSFLDSEDFEHPNINVEKLCSKLFLICDNDDAKEGTKKALRHDKLKERLKDRFYKLEAREIENLLTPNILKETLKTICNKDELVFTEKMFNDEKKLNSSKIGEFIDKNVNGKTKIFEADSGTVKDKVHFAKVAVSQISKFDELSGEAQSLAKLIYNFIKKQNS